MGDELTLLVAQKLSYFIQRFGEYLRLKFVKGWYGHYAHNLNHVLKLLNGHYIYYNPDNNRPGILVELNFDFYPEIKSYIIDEINDEQKARIDSMSNLIDVFESPLSIEILGTVDFIIQNKQTIDLGVISSDINNWTKRKQELMKPHYIKTAYERLMEFKDVLYS